MAHSYTFGFLVLAFVPVILAADKGDITLAGGKVLHEARVVAIGEKTATVVHRGGTENVAVESVPLDVLARAQMEIDAATAEKQRQQDAIAERTEKARAEKLKQQESLRRATEATARARAETAARPATRATETPEARLLALKQKFPPKRVESVGFYRDKRLVAGSHSTTSVQPHGDGGYTISTTRSPGAVIVGKPDTMTVEVPHPDIWSDYRGWIQTATVQSLPVSLERLEQRIDADLIRLGGQTGSTMNSLNAAQARMTIDWINQTLRPYLAQVRALAAASRN